MPVSNARQRCSVQAPTRRGVRGKPGDPQPNSSPGPEHQQPAFASTVCPLGDSPGVCMAGFRPERRESDPAFAAAGPVVSRGTSRHLGAKVILISTTQIWSRVFVGGGSTRRVPRHPCSISCHLLTQRGLSWALVLTPIAEPSSVRHLEK